MDRDALLKQVKESVLEIEPTAELILYGSRARGDSRTGSDWDFLVLVEGPVDDKRVDAIRHRVYEIEWDSGQVLSLIVRGRKEWGSQPLNGTPFHRNVETEGVVL
ncbi:MAG TPA: nucleotidyltransferase domain-containing protein [Sedimentisphaerales bacterium]|jgi:predicted nucleotidyltransferase|nr:nucleotidyltransferase domain-containing protein [Sedimentisphaerales bacterium]HNU29735.1 nucleotidyltransferase domain-containing protein [Sedimentisphaerales bacterium]